MKAVFNLTNKTIAGFIEVEYLNGLLNTFKIEVEQPLTPAQYQKFLSALPAGYEQSNLTVFEELGLKVKEIDYYGRLNANQKLALFCDFFKLQFLEQMKVEQRYIATGTDANKLRGYKVTPDILNAYFTSKHFDIRGKEGSVPKWSVSNFIANYNIVIAEMNLKDKPKGEYPDYWSEKFAATLAIDKLPKYYAHLRNCGLVPKYLRGIVQDWVKPDLFQ